MVINRFYYLLHIIWVRVFAQVDLDLGFCASYWTKMTLLQQQSINQSQNRHILKASDRKHRLWKY